ncbi:hypothetical protein RBB77_01880 [Tunturibacter psychrotolerans]|uniref:Uncharacterized protein n=1 Tax=Tunturiibacter psychrotolerans TaxID=3069686 RepID=A0AAU7ZRT4_9BACT
MSCLKIGLLSLFMAPAILQSQVSPSNNSLRDDRESRECIVKTPGNTVTMEITIHFNTKQSTDGLNVIIVFVDPHGIVLPFTSVHATYIAEERYNLTARVGEQAVIGEYHLTEMRVASQLVYTRAFHADYKNSKQTCIAIEQGIQIPSSPIPEGEIIHIGPPE